MSVAGSPAGHIKNNKEKDTRISICVPFTTLSGQTELSANQ